MFNMTSTRQKVLNLYKRILKTSLNWQSKSELPADTANEKLYIRNEARKLFRLNKDIIDERDIELKIKEAEARLEIGLHYRNPYPRPVYAPPGTMAGIDERKKKIYKDKLQHEGKPIYIQSIRDE